MKFGIANPCWSCGHLTKRVVWVEDKQRPICESCEDKIKKKEI